MTTLTLVPSSASVPDSRRVWILIGVLVIVGVLFIPFSIAVWGVEYNYTLRTVAVGGALLGAICGVIGSFAVLRRESLVGDALSHAALPGVGVGFLIAGRDMNALLIGAGISSWLGVQFIGALTRTTRLKQDTALGIVLAAWFAAGIALLAFIQTTGNAAQAGLDKFIFGQAAAMVESDVTRIAAFGIFMLVVLLLFWKEFTLITFDPGFARANGIRVGILSTLLSALIVAAVVLGLQIAGVILMVGLLIAPGVAARQWTHRLGQMCALAGVFGAFAGGVGAILSALDSDIPTGPMIIVASSALVVLSLAFAPGRGIVWAWLKARADRRQYKTV
ncbi:MAG: metal ABC transporter permease [Chloroflexota bacterium]|nr:metal ABC transporter permease [Chloroflexota bacterium]